MLHVLPSQVMASVDTMDMPEAFWQVISFIQRVVDNMNWVGISRPAYDMEERKTESSGSEGGDDGEGMGSEQMGVDTDA